MLQLEQTGWPVTILLADDDPDDRELTRDALQDARLANEMHCVVDGSFRSYDLGVNSFITKPVTFAGLVDAMRAWSRYWFELVELPINTSADDCGLRSA